ncbi:MAG: DUF2256 and DUF3253 domain-containing protein [Planctomycetota bacterium]|nr:DUF2256 and DUF3253 domain-containing protein [Planctomycetota bacterium]
MPANPPTKLCAACGRPFSWRKRFERVWDEVRYCSKACRRRKVSRVDAQLEQVILDLTGQRPSGSICPSEAARAVEPDADAWRPLMEPARRAARRLAHQGLIEITQKGHTVDPGTFRGPIRLRRAPGRGAR